MKRYIGVLALSLLLIPGAGFAASKEQQEMQRDIAQLQDQVRTLQSGFDQKMATLQTLVEQALDAGNKANTSVSVLNASVTQTLDRELKDALRPVAGLTAKVDNANNDLSDVKNSMADLTTQINRLQQQLTDINNAIKVIQAPPAAPPPSNDDPERRLVERWCPASGEGAVRNAVTDYNAARRISPLSTSPNSCAITPTIPTPLKAQFNIGRDSSWPAEVRTGGDGFRRRAGAISRKQTNARRLFYEGHGAQAGRPPRCRGHRVAHFDQEISAFGCVKSQAAEQLRAMGLSTGATTAAR